MKNDEILEWLSSVEDCEIVIFRDDNGIAGILAGSMQLIQAVSEGFEVGDSLVDEYGDPKTEFDDMFDEEGSLILVHPEDEEKH